jgi:hypothetical protein
MKSYQATLDNMQQEISSRYRRAAAQLGFRPELPATYPGSPSPFRDMQASPIPWMQISAFQYDDGTQNLRMRASVHIMFAHKKSPDLAIGAGNSEKYEE